MKQCNTCREIKKDTEFYKKKRGWLSAHCKPCTSVYYKKRYSQRTKEVMQEPILSREEARLLYEQVYG